MHLVTFERVDGRTTDAAAAAAGVGLGALLRSGPRAGDVVDLGRATALRIPTARGDAPGASSESPRALDILGFLAQGASAMAEAQQSFDWVRHNLGRSDAPDFDRAGVVLDRSQVLLRAPVPRPGKILGVARNYLAHARERGQREAPVEPVLFLKAVTAVAGPGDEIVLPRASAQVDYEGELAVVIGQLAREVPVEKALDFVAGYCVANDLSARDFQKVRGQSFIGKSCDGFAPMGPALVTGDDVPEPQNLRLVTTVSGERRQDGSTNEMIFSVAEIIAFASRLMTLEPGDVILTGTPSGVGAASTPPRWLADGDVVEVEIEGLGLLRNPIRNADVSA